MRYETLHHLQIPKVGFGTWTIGGHGNPDPSSDDRSLQALRNALELGYTHFDTAEGYAAGHSEELIGQVIREMKVPREFSVHHFKSLTRSPAVRRSLAQLREQPAQAEIWITWTFT